jgi:hypothetical protein
MSQQNKRSLKIEAVGDFAAGKTKPQIRLTGRWLEKAGFKPGHRATVQIPKTGEMTIKIEGNSSIP